MRGLQFSRLHGPGRAAPTHSQWTHQKLRRSPQRQLHIAHAKSDSATDNPLLAAFVSFLTETLRVVGVGRSEYQQVRSRPPTNPPLGEGDVAGVISRIQKDYEQAYFVTGVIDDSIYDSDCYFADPTVNFKGLELWKRNLQLLVPFLVEPTILLKSIGAAGHNLQGVEVLRAEWQLRTHLALPWRPLIDIGGATEYTLNSSSNKVVRHVEFWSVSGLEAVLQLFRPGAEAKAS